MRTKAIVVLFVLGSLFILFGITQQHYTKSVQDTTVESIKGTDVSISPTHVPTPTSVLPTTDKKQKQFYQVVRVIDGDTIKVEIDWIAQTVRLIGIDTPEIVDPKKPIECFGKEAFDKLKALLSGSSIILESDPTQGNKDKYQRLLRYVFLADGLFINKYMIAEGFAHEYTYRSNPYKYQQEFIQAEKDAREQKKGLWAEGACKR